MPSPATANIRTQLGVEVTPGTAVPATQQLAGLYFTDDPKLDTIQTRRPGHASPSASVRGKGWTDLTPTNDFCDFNSMVYALSSLLGAANISLHTGGTLSHDWLFTLKLIDLALGKTYTLERGPTTSSAGRKYAYVALDALTISGTKDSVKITAGHAFGREISEGITLTADVPELDAASMAGINTNVYLDTTSGGIGTTQLTLSEWSVAFSNFYGPKYDVNRAQTSYDKLVPLVPDVTVTLKVEADADAWAFFGYLRAGSLVYPRIDIQGAVIEGSIKNELIIDSALFITQPAAFGDDQGVDSIMFTGKVGEDPAWNSGQSLIATVTNGKSSL